MPLREKRYLFKDATDIVSTPSMIAEYLWPEEHYKILNVIYKATKNSKKLIKALAKHKTALMKIADMHIINSTDYIKAHDSIAFSSIVDYYLSKSSVIDGEKIAQNLHDKIECAVMIQRMLGKAQEIHSNDIIVEKYSDTDDLTAVIKSFAVFDYLKSILESEEHGYVIDHNVLCAADYGAPQKRNRFVVMGVKK